MFRKTFLCSLACAVAISGAGANNSVSAGGVAARVAAGGVGAVTTLDAVMNFLQFFNVGTDDKSPGDETGVLGRNGAIGQFDHVTKKKGEDGSWKGLMAPIVKGILGLTGIAGSVLPF